MPGLAGLGKNDYMWRPAHAQPRRQSLNGETATAWLGVRPPRDKEVNSHLKLLICHSHSFNMEYSSIISPVQGAFSILVILGSVVGVPSAITLSQNKMQMLLETWYYHATCTLIIAT